MIVYSVIIGSPPDGSILPSGHLRQSRVIDKGFDPGRAAEHRLQLRQSRDRVEIGPHKGEVFDIGRIPDLGKDADFETGNEFGEGVAPRLRVADLPVEPIDQQRHVSSEFSRRKAKRIPPLEDWRLPGFAGVIRPTISSDQ